MTCCRYSDLKSSVYNQTGEGFFDQLKAYNHMTTHLKKVYLAKSVVDSRNPNYVRRGQRCRSVCRDKSLEKNVSSDVIDRLAYDTENHPIDILKMDCNFTYHCNKCNRTTRRTPYCDSWYTDCQRIQMPCSTRRADHERSRSISRSRMCCSGPTFHSAGPEKSVKKIWRTPQADASDEEVEMSVVPHGNVAHSSSRSSPRSGKGQYNDEATCSNYASSFESSSETSRQGSPVERGPKSNRSSGSSPRNSREPRKNLNFPENISEEAKYSKFLFDITQEIVHNGFYTDEELEKVFKKHLRKNSSFLDRNKMLYEIYQLKLSLNIINGENEEEEEGIEDFIRSRKFTSIFPVKPPTPPKVLDENKLLDKLRNQDELQETYSRSPHNGRNAVVLIDANPELVVTERDILATLMEMNLDPQQVQNIYKRLQNKSKDSCTKEDKSSSPMSHLKSMSRGVQSRFTPCGALEKDPGMENDLICPREHCRIPSYHRESLERLSRKSKFSEGKESSSSKTSLRIRLMEESASFENPEERISRSSQSSAPKRTFSSESFTKVPSSGRSSKDSENSGRSSEIKFIKTSEDRSNSSFGGRISSDQKIEMNRERSSRDFGIEERDRSKSIPTARISSDRTIDISNDRSSRSSRTEEEKDRSKSTTMGISSSDRATESKEGRSSKNSEISSGSKYLSAESLTVGTRSRNSSQVDKKDFDKTASSKNNVPENSEDRSRSPSAPERLQSIQEVSTETETQLPTESFNYTTDDDTVEDESFASGDSQPENQENSESGEDSNESSEEESINENLSAASHNSS